MSFETGPRISGNGFEAPGVIEYTDDFLSSGVALPTAAGVGMPWILSITGAAPPTGAYVADSHGGEVALALTAASQAQEAALTWANQRNFLVTRGGYMSALVKVAVAPTSLAKFFIGLGSDRAADPDAVASFIGFEFQAAGVVAVSMDDASTDTNTATGITAAVNDIFALGIDFSLITDVKFFLAKNPTIYKPIDWQRVLQTSRFNFAATGAAATLQPYVAAAKASGTGVGTLNIDRYYVRGNR